MITIGQQFEEERLRQKLTLDQVSKATKIRGEFLEAIEAGDYKKLPGSSYAQGFVRNYAKFLGLPVERSLALFRREFNVEKSFDVLPKGLTNPQERIGKFRIGRNILLIAGLFIVIGLFILFQYRAAFLNPGLKIDYPKENQTVKTLTIDVRGKTDPDTTIFIEGEAVSVNTDGTFTKEIAVFPGKSTINFLVENKFGRKTQKSLDIIVKP